MRIIFHLCQFLYIFLSIAVLPLFSNSQFIYSPPDSQSMILSHFSSASLYSLFLLIFGRKVFFISQS
jgi:hypothetical protein